MSLKFKTVTGDQLYYGLYRYCAAFRLQECWVYRYTYDYEEIDRRIDKQQQWREQMRARWPAGGVNRFHTDITDVTKNNLKLTAGFIQSIVNDYKMVIDGGQRLRLYTNDLDLLHAVNRLSWLTSKQYSIVQVNRPRNTVLLKNPQHQHRSYFRDTKIGRAHV